MTPEENESLLARALRMLATQQEEHAKERTELLKVITDLRKIAQRYRDMYENCTKEKGSDKPKRKPKPKP